MFTGCSEILTCSLLLLRWRVSLQERMVKKNVKWHPFFRITTQQAKQEILKFWRCPNGKSGKDLRFDSNRRGKLKFNNLLWCQVGVLFVKVFQLLRCVSLEWGFSCQTLKHDGSEWPEIYEKTVFKFWLLLRGRQSYQLLHHIEETWWLQVPCTRNIKKVKSSHGIIFLIKLTIGDPQSVAAIFPSWRNLAKPKSAIFKVMLAGDGRLLPQVCDSNIFCGFRSLCTMPLAKRAFIAPAKNIAR